MVTRESWEIDPLYREPYILKGYRKPCCSFKESLRYTTRLHNDAVNFWTHFIPFLIWTTQFIDDLNQSWTAEAAHQPLVCFRLAMCVMALCSSVAHAFSTMHTRAFFHAVFMLDYVGISVFGFTWNVCFLYYKHPMPGFCGVFAYKELWLTLFSAVSVFCTIITCVTRHCLQKEVVLLRAITFCAPVILSMCIHLLCLLHTNESDINTNANWLYILVYTLMLVAVFFYGSKLPEKLLPGKFDLFGHSHQFFHIFGACSVHLLNKALTNDAARFVEIAALKNSPHTDSSLLSSIDHTWSLFATVTVVNFSIVLTVAHMEINCIRKRTDTEKQFLPSGSSAPAGYSGINIGFSGQPLLPVNYAKETI